MIIKRRCLAIVRTSLKDELNTYDDWYTGAVGFLASYNGRFFDGGYSGAAYEKDNTTRNYYDESKRNLEKQAPDILDVTFRYDDYTTLGCSDCVIYCDPPYKSTKQYGTSKDFDHDKFWGWVREMSKRNIVLVSEHIAPDDFDCIWQQEILRTINTTKRTKTIEKLFILNK